MQTRTDVDPVFVPACSVGVVAAVVAQLGLVQEGWPRLAAAGVASAIVLVCGAYGAATSPRGGRRPAIVAALVLAVGPLVAGALPDPEFAFTAAWGMGALSMLVLFHISLGVYQARTPSPRHRTIVGVASYVLYFAVSVVAFVVWVQALSYAFVLGQDGFLPELAVASVVLVVVQTIPALPASVELALRAGRLKSWSLKELVSTGLASFAVVVSLLALLQPGVADHLERRGTALLYFQYVGSAGSFPTAIAEDRAAPDSPAARFATKVEDVWRGSYPVDVDVRTIYPVNGWDIAFDVCWPTLDTLPFDCARAADVVFSEDGRVQDFTLDRVPISTLVDIGDPDDDRVVELTLVGAGRPLGISEAGALASVETPSGDPYEAPVLDDQTYLFVVDTDVDAQMTDASFTTLDGRSLPTTVVPPPFQAGLRTEVAVRVDGVADGTLRMCFTGPSASEACTDFVEDNR